MPRIKHNDYTPKFWRLAVGGALGVLVGQAIRFLILSGASFRPSSFVETQSILLSLIGLIFGVFASYTVSLLLHLDQQLSHIIDNQKQNNAITQFNSRSNDTLWGLVDHSNEKIRSSTFEALSNLFQDIETKREKVEIPGEFLVLSSYYELWKKIVEAQYRLKLQGREGITVWATHATPINIWNRKTDFTHLIIKQQNKFVQEHGGVLARILVNREAISSLDEDAEVLAYNIDAYRKAFSDMKLRGVTTFYLNAQELLDKYSFSTDFMALKIPALNEYDEPEYIVSEWHIGEDRTRIQKCVLYNGKRDFDNALGKWKLLFEEILPEENTVPDDMRLRKADIPKHLLELMPLELQEKINLHLGV